MAQANLNANLPIIGEYLYTSFSASGTGVFPSLTPGVSIPSGAYGGYASPVSFSGTIELRSRFFRFEIIFPAVIELVLFGTASGTAQAVDRHVEAAAGT